MPFARSLRAKLALLISFLIGAISLVVFFYVPSRLQDQTLRSVIDEAYNVTDMAAYSVAPGLVAGERGEVFDALSTVRANSKISYVMVFDERGELFASFNDQLAERMHFREIPMKIRPEMPLISKRGRSVQTEGGFSEPNEIFQTTAPVLHRGRKIGQIFVAISIADIYKEIARSRRTIALLSFGLFLLGVTAAIAISAAMTRSLSRIVETTKKIASGDLDKRAEVVNRDEVGQLARSFNVMVDRLQSAQLDLAGLNAGLEKRVEERTRELTDEIDERQRAEEALRQSEQRHRHLFEHNLAGVYIKLLEGEILSCNDALARMLGFLSNRDFLAANGKLTYYDPADEQALLERLLERGSVTNYEVRLRARNGEAIWVLENISLNAANSGAFLEGIVLDITDRKRAEQEIEYRAYHDVLTSLPNRAYFKEHLNAALPEAVRKGRHVAVMFLDLDDLKVVNDTLGHIVGDQLLQRVGDRLSAVLRGNDTVARVGGDEFTVLLADVQGDEAVTAVAEKVIQAFVEPFLIADDEVRVTASVGVAVYPADGDDAEALLVNADRTMYRVKESGGNGYQFCSRVGAQTGLGRLSLEQSLRRALDREEFLVYYQPQVSLVTGEICGMEALVRWNHPDGMIVEPGNFIALAEYTGLIVPIGEWVLREAARQTRIWTQDGRDLRVGVNLSARQFHQRDFVGMAQRVIDTTGIDPKLLELEITESIAMQTTDWTVAVLEKLKDLGLSIAIDDFGTGQTSLSHLNRFPIDTIKIDRSFVSELGKDVRHESAIVTAILLLGRSMSLRTVAEGVEHAGQCDILRRYQCDVMQGYYFSPPIPAAQFEKLLLAEAPAWLS